MNNADTNTPVSREVQNKVLRHYLRIFAVPLPRPVLEEFDRRVGRELRTMYVTDTPERLKQWGKYMLLVRGRVDWGFKFTHEMVDVFFDRAEDEDASRCFYNTRIPLYVLYHQAHQIPNKLLSDMIVQVVQQRAILNKPTLVLCEKDLPLVRAAVQALGAPVVTGTSGASSSASFADPVAPAAAGPPAAPDPVRRPSGAAASYARSGASDAPKSFRRKPYLP